MIIIRLYKKIKQRINLIKCKNNLSISKNSIMANEFRVNFITNKEKRIYVTIGDKSIVNCEIRFESEKGSVEIGNNVYIGGGLLISRESIHIGNDVTIAWGVTIYDHNSHSIYWEERKNDNSNMYNEMMNGTFIKNKDWSNVKSAPIIIQDKVWIGFDVVILKGVTIGEGSVIGARSVVTKDVPPYTVVAGNPAKVIKHINKDRLDNEIHTAII